MDLSILFPKTEQTLLERFMVLKDLEVKFEPYDGDVCNQRSDEIVDAISRKFHQDKPVYVLLGETCCFQGGGDERVIARMSKTEACELYCRGVELAERFGMPVIESKEDAEKHFGKTIEDFNIFNTELRLIEGRPMDFNGLDSDAHFFVLPSLKYSMQNLIRDYVGVK